jgi:hypothetical protein
MSVAEEINTEAPVTLKITTAGIKAEFEGINGRKIFKNIGLNSMSRILNRDSEFDTGFLPIYGRNYMAIKRYIKMGDKEILFIEASPCNRLIKFGYNSLDEITNVRFPGLMMAVTCRVNNDGTISPKDTRVFATQGPILRDTDQLYRFPFGNVYTPDGRVCWGSAQREHNKIKTLTQAGSLLDTFLFAGMNEDLYSNEQNNTGILLEEYLETLQDKSEFPYSDLKPEITFKDLTSLLKSSSIG